MQSHDISLIFTPDEREKLYCGSTEPPITKHISMPCNKNDVKKKYRNKSGYFGHILPRLTQDWPGNNCYPTECIRWVVRRAWEGTARESEGSGWVADGDVDTIRVFLKPAQKWKGRPRKWAEEGLGCVNYVDADRRGGGGSTRVAQLVLLHRSVAGSCSSSRCQLGHATLQPFSGGLVFVLRGASIGLQGRRGGDHRVRHIVRFLRATVTVKPGKAGERLAYRTVAERQIEYHDGLN